jgi:hypothetical protein
MFPGPVQQQVLNFLNNCKNTGSALEKVLQSLLENYSPYAGDITKPQQFHKIVKLGQTLTIPNSFLQRFTPRGERYDSIFELLTVHAAPRQKTTIFDSQRFSALTMSMMVGTIGRFSWMTSHTMKGMGRSTNNDDISHEQGCAVILRPDQYVSYVGPVDDYDAMDKFFTSFMIPQGGWNESGQRMLASGQSNKVYAINGNAGLKEGGDLTSLLDA